MAAGLDRPDEAAAALRRFLDVSTGRPEGPLPGTVAAWVLLAEVHLDGRRAPEEALVAARAAVGLRSGHPPALRLIERALFALADWSQLADHHREAIHQEPERAAAHCRELAYLLETRLSDPAEALRVLLDAGERFPNDLGAAESLRRVADALSDDRAGTVALRRLSVLRPHAEGRAEAYCSLADVRLGLADPRGATEALLAAAEEAPRHPEVARRLVEARRRIGEPMALADALRTLAEVVLARGERTEAHDLEAEAGRVLADAGRLAEAADALRHALSLEPRRGRAGTMLALADVEERQGAYAEARAAYAAVRNLGQATGAARLAEARVAEHLGDLGGARELLTSVVDAESPEEADEALDRLVALHRKAGDHVAVAAALERAGRTARDAERAAELWLGAAHTYLGPLADRRAAERVLWQLTERVPDHAQGLQLLVQLSAETDDHKALARAHELRAQLPGQRVEALRALGALCYGPLARRAPRETRLRTAPGGGTGGRNGAGGARPDRLPRRRPGARFGSVRAPPGVLAGARSQGRCGAAPRSSRTRRGQPAGGRGLLPGGFGGRARSRGRPPGARGCPPRAGSP